jgi:peptidoglycan/LPS O-acetylase OafA/YrhL
MYLSDSPIEAVSTTAPAKKRVATTVNKIADVEDYSPVFRFRHIPELDGFRGLAVLIVIVGHYLEYRLPNLNPYFATLDKLGVLLFFVLSGFLSPGCCIENGSLRRSLIVGAFIFVEFSAWRPPCLFFSASSWC